MSIARQRTVWYPKPNDLAPPPPIWIKPWLESTDSMTQRIEKTTHAPLVVQILNAGWGAASLCEQSQLDLGAKVKVWVREVALYSQGQAWIVGRAVFPKILEGQLQLRQLGTRPLGHVIYQGHSLQRESLSFCALNAGDALYQLAAPMLATPTPTLWGRRSVFNVDGVSFLLSEIFLPKMIAALSSRRGQVVI